MPPNEKGVRGWIRGAWRALLAEVVSTALLVSLGVASLLPEGAQLTHAALAFGCVVIANLQAFGAVSGAHMNPAVTLAALIYGVIAPALAAAYVFAQALGAIIGMAVLAGVSPRCGVAACTGPGEGVSPVAAACVEALLTGLLAFLCCGVWREHDPLRPDPAIPLKFGFTVAGLVYAGGALSGASLNPVRSLAPALLYPCWAHHWVYWVGPLGGAAAATLLHKLVLAPPAPKHDPLEVELPLHDKRNENNQE